MIRTINKLFQHELAIGLILINFALTCITIAKIELFQFNFGTMNIVLILQVLSLFYALVAKIYILFSCVTIAIALLLLLS